MKNPIKRFLIFLIKIYQKTISPAKPPSCRFTPTCSNYAIEAITVHGVFKGTALALWRILRCNPFCKGGYDPVPEKKKNLTR
ncbi:MAG: membrane protein insertion efficiency factor YidD [Clostridia bacterium]|nr:membrane protein insertion efficiency factor YidD [Clostridia bacterium]